MAVARSIIVHIYYILVVNALLSYGTSGTLARFLGQYILGYDGARSSVQSTASGGKGVWGMSAGFTD